MPSRVKNAANQGIVFDRKYIVWSSVSLVITGVISFVLYLLISNNVLNFAAVKGANPALYWKFDEGSGSTANDSSGNNNPGSIVGSAWQTSEFCISENCLYFDGSGDSVSKTYSSDTELNPGTGSFTVSTWFKHARTAPASNQALIMRYNEAGYAVYMTTTGTICFAIDDDTTWNPDDVACSTASYLDSTWHHITAVKNGSSSIQLFIDNKLIAEDTSLAATGSLSGTNPGMTIGGNAFGSSGTYTQQISANNRDGEQWTSWDANNLWLGNWDGTDETGAYHFSNVTIPQGATITSAVLTVEAETSSSDPSGVDLRIFANNVDNASLPSGTNLPRSMAQTTATVNWDPTAWVADTRYNLPDISTVIQEVVNRAGWASGNAMNILIDDRGTTVQDDIETSDYSKGAGDAASITINWSTGGGGPSFSSWNGFIDEVKVFNYALNQSQMQSNQVPGSPAGAAVAVGGNPAGDTAATNLSNGLIAYWKMDESSYSGVAGEIRDSSGNGYHGTRIGNMTTSGGKYGMLGYFDGTGDYFDPDSDFNWQTMTPSGFTYSAWILILSTGTRKTIYSNGHGFVLEVNASNNFSASIRGSANGGALQWNPLIGTTALSTMNWYHVAVVYNPAGASELYVNGRREATSGSTKIAYAHSGSSDDYIGRCNASCGGNFDFNGGIDELKIYNRPLSQKEVIDLYNWAPPPLVHLKMDENTGTSSTVDSSGNGNNGTLSNSPQWIRGKFGSALGFNGSNTRVSVADNQALRPESGSMTISFWANPANADQGSLLAGKIQNSSPYEQWSVGVCGNISCSIPGQNLVFTLTQDNSTTYRAAMTSDVVDGNWHHYSAVVDSLRATITIYIDGIPVSTTNATLGSWPTINNTDPMEIGSYAGGGYYSGGMDDVKFYNYARSSEQVLEDMGAGHPATSSSTNTAHGWWKFDEITGTTAPNSGLLGTLGAGTLSNFASPATSSSGWTTDGKLGRALIFDGADDIVNLGSDTAFDNMTSVTFSAWIYPTGWGESNFGRIIAKENTGTAIGFNLVNDSGQNSFRVYKERATSATQATARAGSITLNTWQHVAGVIDVNNNIVRLYHNGREVGSYIDQTMGSGTFTDDAASNLNIGNRTAGDRTFAGRIDDVRVYTAALSDEQIAELYNQGNSVVAGALSTESNGITVGNSAGREYCVPGDTSACSAPIVEWKFDENTGTSVTDKSGNAVTGSFISSPVWTRGKQGSALNFDGVDDAVNFGNNTQFVMGTSLTMQAWIKPESYNPDSGIFINKWVSGVEDKQLTFYPDGRVYFYLHNVMGGSVLFSNSTIPLNQWSHIVGVYNGSTAAIYINGRLDSSKAASGNVADSTGNFYLGGSLVRGSQYGFDGSIDDVKIYNYARSPAQIAWDYNRGGPAGWWKLDECAGTTANDSSGFGNNGTLSIGASGSYTSSGTCNSETGTHAWNAGSTGKFNSALGFDGTNDYINMGDPTSGILDFGTNSFSLAAWVKTSSTGYRRVISKGMWGWTSGYVMHLESGGGFITAGLGGNGSESNSVLVRANVAINDNQWHHIVDVFDKTNNTVQIYIDGNPVAITKVSNTCGTVSGTSLNISSCTSTNGSTTENFYIGATPNGNEYWDGLIDDVRVYNYALTKQQVQIIYNKGAAMRFGE